MLAAIPTLTFQPLRCLLHTLLRRVLGSLLLFSEVGHRQNSEDRYSVLPRSRDRECGAPALLRQGHLPLSAMQLELLTHVATSFFTLAFFVTSLMLGGTGA